jgi:hypothetical protein
VKELSYEDITRRIQPIGVTKNLLWSKDGSKIVYVMCENKTTNIYTINVGKPSLAKTPISELPTEKQPGIPGFEAIFTIAGLLAVVYLWGKRK